MKGNLSDYSFERIAEIRETLAVLLNCTSKEILIGGACPSNSFLLVLSIKETYSCKLSALKQCDKDKLTKLNIDYIIVDLIVINLESSKGNTFMQYIFFYGIYQNSLYFIYIQLARCDMIKSFIFKYELIGLLMRKVEFY